MTTPIAELTKGHWSKLLPALGVDRKFLTNRHGPCPICNGKDRFRWDDMKGLGGYICSQCGAGDGFDLAMNVTGKTFREIAVQITQILGPTPFTPKQPDQDEAANLLAMQKLWGRSGRPILDGPVSHYLTRRIGCQWHSNLLREAFDVRTEGQLWSAMIWKVITHTDKAVNLHQTFLTMDGQKADVSVGKKVMAGKLPDGCAIRTSPAKPAMGVAEGVESALSASFLYDMPVWACINGNVMSKWIPPECAEEIHIFGDNDLNFTGHAKAYALANRLEVLFKRKVTVVFPEVSGQDMNDVHRNKMQQGVASEAYIRVIK